MTLMEILVKPKEQGDKQAVEDYSFVLKTFPNLTLRPIDESCSERASDLRPEYGVKPPDALQVATALTSYATCFVTNDDKLKRIRELAWSYWTTAQGAKPKLSFSCLSKNRTTKSTSTVSGQWSDWLER
jgi:hypothetical protein